MKKIFTNVLPSAILFGLFIVMAVIVNPAFADSSDDTAQSNRFVTDDNYAPNDDC